MLNLFCFIWCLACFSVAMAKDVCISRQELTAKSLGIVTKYYVTDGSKVTKGQPIVEFDSRLLRAARKEAQGAVDAAKANFDLAKDSASRLEQLRTSDSVTQQQLAEAKIRLAQAEAVVRQAQGAWERVNVQIADTLLKAEIPGTVKGLPSILGMAVQPGQSLGRIEADAASCIKKVD